MEAKDGDTVDVQLEIENHYELHPTVITRPGGTVPAPEDYTQEALDEWAWEHLFDFTGAGVENGGGSLYAVKVTAASDPRLVGFYYEFM